MRLCPPGDEPPQSWPKYNCNFVAADRTQLCCQACCLYVISWTFFQLVLFQLCSLCSSKLGSSKLCTSPTCAHDLVSCRDVEEAGKLRRICKSLVYPAKFLYDSLPLPSPPFTPPLPPFLPEPQLVKKDRFFHHLPSNFD
jgi:hypothetical protein